MAQKEKEISRLFLPSLVLAGFATQPPETILSLLLIEISESFNTPFGTMAQIRTTAALLTLITAITMGLLSIRIKHKTLLLSGLAFLIISGTGCSIANNYTTILIAYSLSGIGLAMVSPMAFALIGKHIPTEKRANATGYFIAGNASSFVVGGPVLSYLTQNNDWRAAFQFYMLPLAILGFALCFFGIPTEGKMIRGGKHSVIDGFRRLVSNKSVIACLLGGLLAKATWQGVISYGVTYYREYFQLSKIWGSLVLSGIAFSFILGVLSSGRFINRYGRKKVTVVSFFLTGLFSVFYMLIGLFWVSITVILVMGVMSGFRRNAGQSLSLEQLPDLRGSMMSLSSAADSLGSVLGAGLGGYILMVGEFWMIGAALGLVGVLSAIIINYLAIDPSA